MPVLKATIKSFLVLAITFVFLPSCQKYENGPIFSMRTKKARLTGTWQLKKLILNDDEKLNFAHQDALYTFFSNGEYTIQYPQNNESEEGTWDFADQKDMLFLDIGGNQELYSIKRLKNKSLWIEKSTGQDALLYQFRKKD